jgi:tetratricopeptide (TPR) repeat protein
MRALALCFVFSLAAQPQEDLFARGQAQQQSGRLTEAEGTYRQYLKLYGPRAEVLANLGALLSRQDKFDEAVQAYQQALKLAPALTPIHLNLGLAFFKAGRHAEAIPAFTAFLQREPQHAQARQLRAISYLESDRFAEAIADYQSLPAADAGVALGLATAYTRMGDTAKAREYLEPLLTRESAETQLLLTQVFLMDEQVEQAERALEKALALKPDLATGHYLRGIILWRRQEIPQAMDAWRRELARDARSFPANFALGAALSLEGVSSANPQRLQQAREHFRRAVALKPKSAPALYQLAKLLWRTKQSETVPLLERAVAAQPGYREAHYLLANVYQTLGRKAEAAREFAVVQKLTSEGAKKARDLFEISQ